MNGANHQPRTFHELREAAEKHPGHWRDLAALEFAQDLYRLMEEQGVSRAQLARSLGTSAPYVTQMLRADSNFTIGTMARVAMVFDHRLRIHLAPKHSITVWKDSVYVPHGLPEGMAGDGASRGGAVTEGPRAGRDPVVQSGLRGPVERYAHGDEPGGAVEVG